MSTAAQQYYANTLDKIGAFGTLTSAQLAALDLDHSGVGAIARARHWAAALTEPKIAQIATGLETGRRFHQEIDAISRAAGGIADAIRVLRRDDLSITAGAIGSVRGLETASAKMSLFAGALDVLGPGVSSKAAYDALLGGYNPIDVFERDLLRNPRERAAYYHDQGVDEGLIGASSAETIEALIESGTVEGETGANGRMTAIIEVGSMRMKVSAYRPKLGAFNAIDHFEGELRAFVSAKLTRFGPSWFVQRVPGDIVKRARQRKLDAVKDGEIPLELIHYTDLGDLMTVIVSNNNWTEVFEIVFVRRDWLRTDLERLNALRRPTMHGRPIDAVQLSHVLLNIRSLTSWMQQDGAWAGGWDESS